MIYLWQEFPESLELSGRWSQLLAEGEKQRNVIFIFIHRDMLSAAANIRRPQVCGSTIGASPREHPLRSRAFSNAPLALESADSLALDTKIQEEER